VPAQLVSQRSGGGATRRRARDEDLRLVAGQQIVNDMANGAEAYLQMWARAEVAAG
jgi:hypothetical protein